MPASASWDAADRAARAAACAMNPTSNGAGAFAIRAEYESTTLVNVRHHQSTLDAATAFAMRAHARAAADTAASRADRTGQGGDRLVASPRRAGQLGQ
jgi:hypothetical protein